MAYVYHCRLSAEQYGFTYEEFFSENRMAKLTSSHFKDPVRIEGLAVSPFPPHELKSPCKLIFYHMFIREPQKGQMLYLTQGDDPRRCLRTLISGYGESKKLSSVLFIMEALTRDSAPENLMGIATIALRKHIQEKHYEFGHSTCLNLTFSKSDLDRMDFDNMMIFHNSFSCGKIDDNFAKEVEFTSWGEPERLQKERCLALDLHKINIPLEMFAIDTCWQPLPAWERGGCIITCITK